MGDDLDPLDDIFAEEAMKNARPAGKFQPKAKFRPAKRNSAATSVSLSQAVVQTTDSVQGERNEPVVTAKPSDHCSNVVLNDGGSHASMEKSVGENADIFIGLETLGDFLPHATTESSVSPSEASSLNASNPENAGGLANPVLSSVEHSSQTGQAVDVQSCPEVSAELDPLTAGEPIVSSSDGHGHVHDTELGREEMDVMDSINISELTTKSGQRKGKFQPKPKIQMHKEKEICEAREPVSHSLDSQSVPPEISYGEKDSIPMFQQDDVLDLSSLGFGHTLPANVTTELPLNEESVNLMEMTQLESGIHLEGAPEVPAKLASRRAKTGSTKTPTASDPSLQQQKASTSSQENETGRILRPRKRKTNFCELVDEADDEVLANGEFSEERPLDSALEEENINDEEFQVESESQTKKVKRKSKKTDDNKEKLTRKQKKAKEASDQDTVAKPKKFSHSTRRRRVDKALLETPEDDIDYQKVPLRDLILLAEHKEKLMKKEEAAAGASGTKQSNGDSSGRYNEDENFTSNLGDGERNDGQGSPEFEDTTVYFNYQTYMDKTPSTRWTKQDTELFYEAIRQFGTDLSMIQQLFPDRTRRQVKLKYKKEERQHPLRLREALTNRPKDHSHFEKVIERLKQIAAEENQNVDKDDLIDLTDNEVADGGTSKIEKEEAKDEHVEEEENGDVANEFIEAESPLKSDGDDDDFWSQYKSDI